MLKWTCLFYVRESILEIFNKKSLTAEEQIELLISRGLKVTDKQSAVDTIKRIGYYHLSSYMRIYQTGEQHHFLQDISFKDIYNLYQFDQELRHITFKAIEKIEIAYRVAISNVMCKKLGSHWFEYPKAFKDESCIEKCKEIITKEIKKKDDEYAETFISNYYNKYSHPELPPFWMSVETFTIGSLNKLFQLINPNYKTDIIRYFNITEDAKFIRFSNWLYALSVVRNICAHHSRLFNRIFRIAPTRHIKIVELRNSNNNTFYYIALVINYYLTTMSNDISFEHDLRLLFDKYGDTCKTKMGFPTDWTNFTITRIPKKQTIKV